MEVPSISYHIYNAYLLGLCKRVCPQNMAEHMAQYLDFRILEFPLTLFEFLFCFNPRCFLLKKTMFRTLEHGGKSSHLEVEKGGHPATPHHRTFSLAASWTRTGSLQHLLTFRMASGCGSCVRST